MKNLKDAALRVTKALPAAAANSSSDALDFGQYEPMNADLLIAVPATPALVDTKVITFKVQSSADDVTYTDTGYSFTTVGAGGAGAAAVEKRFRPASNANRYFRVNAAVETGGGSNVGVSYTLEPVF